MFGKTFKFLWVSLDLFSIDIRIGWALHYHFAFSQLFVLLSNVLPPDVLQHFWKKLDHRQLITRIFLVFLHFFTLEYLLDDFYLFVGRWLESGHCRCRSYFFSQLTKRDWVFIEGDDSIDGGMFWGVGGQCLCKFLWVGVTFVVGG